MLYRTPELGDAEMSVIREVDALKDRLRALLREPRRWDGSLRRLAMARAILGSNSIEGFSAPLDDVVAVELGEAPLDPDQETTLALKGYRDAMTYVIQLATEQGFRYSTQLIKSLHFMMTGYDLRSRPGLWRTGAIYVRNDATGEIVYEGADVDEVPALVEELAVRLNEDDETPPMVRAAMAHLDLVMIHPFRDGNGRMARSLQTLVLARQGTLLPVFSSVEEYLGANTQAYYDVLASVGGGRWQPQRDALPWVRFILTAHLRQARTILRRFKETERLWHELEAVIREAGLPDRVLFALHDAAYGFRVRRSTYRASAGDQEELTQQTATRDLRQLVSAGLLEPQGERRGRLYVASQKVRSIRQGIIAARDPKDESDPFVQTPAQVRLITA